MYPLSKQFIQIRDYRKQRPKTYSFDGKEGKRERQKQLEKASSISYTSLKDSLSSNSTTSSHEPRLHILTQYCLLQQCFPQFPNSMITNLLFREDGNAKHVAKFLMNNGWKPYSNNFLSILSNEPNVIFTTLYFWGKLKPEYLPELRNSPVGSYFTVTDVNEEYHLCFIGCNRKLFQQKISCPYITHEIEELHSLDNPLTRPVHIVVTDLVPFNQKAPTRSVF